jgi:hypothetical protein
MGLIIFYNIKNINFINIKNFLYRLNFQFIKDHIAFTLANFSKSLSTTWLVFSIEFNA